MEKIVIRHATPSDIEGLIPLYLGLHKQLTARSMSASASSNAPGLPENKLGIVGLVASDEAEARRLLRTLLNSEEATIFVASQEGALVGFLEVAMKQDHPGLLSVVQRSGPGYPGSFWITDPSYIQQGVGRWLYTAAFQWVQEQKAS
jgi:GNAT superfamily N-acetyltransferase